MCMGVNVMYMSSIYICVCVCVCDSIRWCTDIDVTSNSSHVTREYSGSLVVRTQSFFHCKEHEFNTRPGNYDPSCTSKWPKKKKNIYIYIYPCESWRRPGKCGSMRSHIYMHTYIYVHIHKQYKQYTHMWRLITPSRKKKNTSNHIFWFISHARHYFSTWVTVLTPANLINNS